MIRLIMIVAIIWLVWNANVDASNHIHTIACNHIGGH